MSLSGCRTIQWERGHNQCVWSTLEGLIIRILKAVISKLLPHCMSVSTEVGHNCRWLCSLADGLEGSMFESCGIGTSAGEMGSVQSKQFAIPQGRDLWRGLLLQLGRDFTRLSGGWEPNYGIYWMCLYLQELSVPCDMIFDTFMHWPLLFVDYNIPCQDGSQKSFLLFALFNSNMRNLPMSHWSQGLASTAEEVSRQ